MRTAVDINVISVFWSQEPASQQMASSLDKAQAEGGLVVAGPVYAELLAHPGVREAQVDEFLAENRVMVDFDLGEASGEWRGTGLPAYAKRRRHSGSTNPKRLLADFLIGAHASISADRLLTLDKNRYSRDFPDLRLM